MLIRLKLCLIWISLIFSEIAYIGGQLNNLPSEALKLKVKEEEILTEEEQIHKMREDLTV